MYKGLLLSGVRVVEVADGWVGPWAGMLLADLGAEVIKVESTTRMDMCRGPGATGPVAGASSQFYSQFPGGTIGENYWNASSQFNAANLSKRDVTLDLTAPKGLQAFMRIAGACDVFLSNLAVGVAEKLGITYQALAEVNPQIIYLASAGYGRTGPYARRVAMGNTIDAASGLFGLRDYGDGDSTAVSGSAHCDAIAALTNALAIVTALNYRRETEKGIYIDVSMVEPSMLHIGEAIMDYTINGRVQKSTGNRDPAISPQGCYRCKGENQWVTISVASDEEWQELAEVTGNPQWAQDERFAGVLGRLEHHDELDGLINAWTAQHTKYEVMELLQQAGIAAGAVLDNGDVYDNVHLQQRGYWDTIEDPDAGLRTYPGRLWKLLATEMTERSHSPRLGEHNDYVLREIAGLTPEEIAELEQEGTIGTAPVIREI